MSRYNFSYFSQEDNGEEFPTSTGVTRDVAFHSGTPWDVVLNEFLSFLSSVYGYDISKHVDVQTFSQRMAAFNNED